MDPAHAPQPPTPKPRETAVVSPVSVTGTTHTHTHKQQHNPHTNANLSRSDSEEETFVFPQSNESEHNKGTPVCKNSPSDSTLSDRSTQTDPGVWTPQKKDKRGNIHNSLLYGAADRKVRQVLNLTQPDPGGQTHFGSGATLTLIRCQMDQTSTIIT